MGDQTYLVNLPRAEARLLGSQHFQHGQVQDPGPIPVVPLDADRARLTAYAKKTGRTVNGVISDAITWYLDHVGQPPVPPETGGGQVTLLDDGGVRLSSGIVRALQGLHWPEDYRIEEPYRGELIMVVSEVRYLVVAEEPAPVVVIP